MGLLDDIKREWRERISLITQINRIVKEAEFELFADPIRGSGYLSRLTYVNDTLKSINNLINNHLDNYRSSIYYNNPLHNIMEYSREYTFARTLYTQAEKELYFMSLMPSLNKRYDKGSPYHQYTP